MGEVGLSVLEDPGLVDEHLVEFCQDAAAEKQSGNDCKENTEVTFTVINDGAVDQVYDEFGCVRVDDEKTGSAGLMVHQTKDNVPYLEVENDMGKSTLGGKEAEELDGLVLEGASALSGKEVEQVDTSVVEGNSNTMVINVEVDSGDTCDVYSPSPLGTFAGNELENSSDIGLRIGCSLTTCEDLIDQKEHGNGIHGLAGLVSDCTMVNGATKQEGDFLHRNAIFSKSQGGKCIDGKSGDTLLLESESDFSKTDEIGILCHASSKVKEEESINLEWKRHLPSNDLEAKKEERKDGFHNSPDGSDPVSQDVSQETVHHPFFVERKAFSTDQVLSRNTKFFPVGECDDKYCHLKQSMMLGSSCPTNASTEYSQPLCNSTAHIATDTDNGSDDKSNPAPTSRRTNPKQAASIVNSSNVGKPDHPNKVKKFQNTVKAVVNGTSFFSSVVHNFSNKDSRKRSFRKIVHTSRWGTIEKLFEIFSLSDIVRSNHSELIVTKRKSTKVRCFSGRNRQSKPRKAGRGARDRDPAINKSAENATQLFLSDLVNSHAPVNTEFNDGLPFIDCQKRTSEIDQVLPVEEYNTIQIPNRYGVSQSPLMPMSGDWRHSDKDPESSVTQETSPENYLCDFPGIMSQVGNESLMELGEGKLSNYSGTSPESDVVQPAAYLTVLASPSLFSDNKSQSENHSPDSSIHDSLHPDVSAMSGLASRSASSLHQCISTMKERSINIEEVLSESFSGEERAVDCGNQVKERKPPRHSTSARRKHVSVDHKFNRLRNNDRRSSKKCLKQNDIIFEPPSMETEPQSHGKNLEVHADEHNCAMPGQNSGGKMTFKEFKAKGRKTKSKCLGSSRDGNNDHQKNEENQDSVCTHKTYKRGLLRKFVVDKGSQLLGVCMDGSGILPNLCSDMVDTSLSSSTDKSTGLNDKLVLKCSDNVFEPHCLPPRAAWVQCDDCHKWRCIPTELADYIDETKCRWTCMKNQDKAFADCSTPQEKSNAEINAELEISEASCEEDACGTQPHARKIENSKLTDKQHSSWTRIRSNLYLHRSRKTQTIDETMVCQCRLRKEGALGCGDECLNRMLNIECVRGTCPCGEMCSNQQFQKRKYTKLKPFPCGKKGHGLQVLENVSQGQFLIEYVGEVLDLATYEARQKEYASRGQKHFYFMTLNGSEVIDACSKGNLGRYINHSCDPNCRTEKWMVNGEVCIGLFAIRDINKGEEVTFDYNYVRVVGAAAKKCVCGSADCKGYIGGDPSNTETTILVDSDDEFPEPLITYGLFKRELDKHEVSPYTHEMGKGDIAMDENVSNDIKACSGKIVDLDRITQNNTDVSGAQGGRSSPLYSDKLSKSSTSDANLDIYLPNLDTTSGTTSAGQPEISLQSSNPVGEITPNPIIKSMNNLSTATVDSDLHPLKPYASKNSSRFSGPSKKSGSGVKNILVQDAKKIVGGNHNNHSNGVEEKLSEVLDADGGISKRKDSTKGFLKLLVVTAALRNNAASEAIQSTRDLCLILDALLKTKSRSVLLDIINKNGLQMLHNIMKQSRKNGSKIPILRKLLKVLESFSQKEILTDELINMAPSCLAVESFRDSITSLTYHNDIQVHQIARSFRDKWFRVRKPILSEVGERRLDTQIANDNLFVPHSKHYQEQDVTHAYTRDANQASIFSSSSSGTCSTSEPSFPLQRSSPTTTSASSNAVIGANPRKRKSRWDQDKPVFKVNSDPECLGSINDGASEAVSGLIKPEAKSHLEKSDDVTVSRMDEVLSSTGASNSINSSQQIIDEVPPGFGSSAGFVSSSERSKLSFDWPCTNDDVVTGNLQERYCPLLSVSHGIPVTLMQQHGTPANIDRGCSSLPNWAVAPGMPFHPFPPLPPYPREKKYNVSPVIVESSLASSHQTKAHGAAEKQCQNGQFDTACQSDQFVASVAGSALCDAKPGVQSNFIIDRSRKPSNHFEKMHRQQRNSPGHHKFRPPWPRVKGSQ